MPVLRRDGVALPARSPNRRLRLCDCGRKSARACAAPQQGHWVADLPSQRGFYNFDEIVVPIFRDGNSLEALRRPLDYRDETSTTRWATGYDFPALNEGRVVKEALKNDNPKGMEGFVFNTRRPLFQDIRLREALGMMFDFEWVNANLYAGLYTRTKSFFDESELSRRDDRLPRGTRLARALSGAVREAFWRAAGDRPSTTAGRDRGMAKRALALLGRQLHRKRRCEGQRPSP
jgi:peptide/nickel transport system substrate-binding protein